MGMDMQVTEYREGRYISSACSLVRRKGVLRILMGNTYGK
jgi:hypothetical protein